MAKNKYKPKMPGLRLWLPLGLAVILGLSTVACLKAYLWLTRAPFLQVETIEVEGAHRVAPLEVVTLAGVAPHTNILVVDQSEISRRVLAHAWVRDAVVTRVIPDKIVVTITERNPLAVVEHRGLHLMDEEGVLFQRVSEPAAWPLPLVTGLGPDEVDRLRVSGPVAARLREIIGVVEKTGQEMAEISFSPAVGFSVRPAGVRFRICLGSEGFTKKLARVARVTNFLKSQGVLERVRYIDLKFEGRVFVSGDFMETFNKET